MCVRSCFTGVNVGGNLVEICMAFDENFHDAVCRRSAWTTSIIGEWTQI